MQIPKETSNLIGIRHNPDRLAGRARFRMVFAPCYTHNSSPFFWILAANRPWDQKLARTDSSC